MHETSEANILDRDLAFSSTLLGKECNRCRRAYRYNYFDRDSSSRDGFSHICPVCLKSPRLSTEEHLYRVREMNDSSHAVEAQRRPNELDYLERDSVGNSLHHPQFIEKLKILLGTRLVVGDAYFLNEFSLYIVDPRCVDTNGVRYIGYIPSGLIQEFSSYDYDKHGVAVNEYARGYRGILMKLIMEKYITELDCARVFGKCEEKVWCRTLYNWRNRKG